jgi:aquaporin Z
MGALREHWPEYLMEAALLGLFMISASTFGALLFHPASPAARELASSPLLRRALMGLAMGATAVALIESPWGRRSGAHVNPATTLTFWRLGKVQGADAAFYVLAQFAGGVLGMTLAELALGALLAHPAVNYVATVPGAGGPWLAFAGEVAISFVLMSVVLHASNSAALARFTSLFVGALLVAYIAFEAPISGMSMNPARTFGSALAGSVWTALWIYFLAPPLGMLAAAELYRLTRGLARVHCAKLQHHGAQRCIFRCTFGKLAAS